MKIFYVLLFLSGAFFAGAQDTWKPLFNGRDLDGWRRHGGDDLVYFKEVSVLPLKKG